MAPALRTSEQVENDDYPMCPWCLEEGTVQAPIRLEFFKCGKCGGRFKCLRIERVSFKSEKI